MKYLVKDIVGRNAISMQSGEFLYKVIHGPLTSGDNVALDFDGVELFASPFFNNSIGLILRDINISDLQKRLKFENLSPVGLQLLNLVISNAIRFYSSDNKLSGALKNIDLDPEK